MVPPSTGQSKQDGVEGETKIHIPKIKRKLPMAQESLSASPRLPRGLSARHTLQPAGPSYRGVQFYRRTGKWEAVIWSNGKQKSLGAFATPEEAAGANDRAVIPRDELKVINLKKEKQAEDSMRTSIMAQQEMATARAKRLKIMHQQSMMTLFSMSQENMDDEEWAFLHLWKLDEMEKMRKVFLPRVWGNTST